MIISELQAKNFIQVQKDTWRWIEATGYNVTILAQKLDLSRQTVTIRFKTQKWRANEFLQVARIINSKK